jgi:NAD(P)-dependent dehydrogenase (short-subunit alcohol dehydrogenase family)
VPRIFITGSTDGLGRAAAGVLISEGHDVVLHARTRERAAALSDLAADAAGVVIGDLSSAAETRDLAGQVNEIGRMDAVIHNAGVFLEPSRSTTAEGHAKTLAVNTLAPYMLTGLIGRPDRLIYLSSGLHHAGAGSLRDIDWTSRSWNAAQAYSESKLHVTALALTLARVLASRLRPARSGESPRPGVPGQRAPRCITPGLGYSFNRSRSAVYMTEPTGQATIGRAAPTMAAGR